jgi:hypothetical protein
MQAQDQGNCERAKPCQDSTANRKRSNTDVRMRCVRKQDPRKFTALVWPCSHRSERAKPCQGGTVIQERSNTKRSDHSNAKCSKHSKVNVRRAMKHLVSSTHLAKTPAVQTICLPVVRTQTRLKTRTESSYGPQMAVAFLHPRFLVETRTHHLGGVVSCRNDELSFSVKKNVSNRRTVPQALSPGEQVTDLPVSPRPTHSKARIKSPYGPQSAVSAIHGQFPVDSCPRHLVGDVELRLNNIGCCSVSENVSEHWTVHPAPSPRVQMTGLPVDRSTTRSKTRVDSSYGPQTAVFSFHQRFLTESCCRHLDGTELRHSDEAHRPARKLVNDRRVAPTALPPVVSTRDSPRFQPPTRSTTRVEPSYEPQPAVAYIHPQFHVESRRRRRLGTELGQIEDIRCSVKDNVSKRWAVPLALPPHMQVGDLPVDRSTTRLKTRIRHSYGPKMAVSSKSPHFHRRKRCRGLDVSRRHHSDTVYMKRSTTNVNAKTNPRVSLTQPQNPRTYTALVWPCFHRSKRAKPCQDGTVIRGRSNTKRL